MARNLDAENGETRGGFNAIGFFARSSVSDVFDSMDLEDLEKLGYANSKPFAWPAPLETIEYSMGTATTLCWLPRFGADFLCDPTIETGSGSNLTIHASILSRDSSVLNAASGFT